MAICTRAKKLFSSSGPVASMVAVQLIETGMQLLSKVILSHGSSILALMTYRHVIAAVLMAPFAFFLESGLRNKLSWKAFFWLYCNAWTGILLVMGLYYYGLRDTTATYAVNFLNLAPIVTFVCSSIFRIEPLALNTKAGKMKTAGVFLSVAGALTASLYKGNAFYILHKHGEATHHSSGSNLPRRHWARGTLTLVGSCFAYSAWFMLQVKLNDIFPLKYWATLFTCIIAFVHSAILELCFGRSKVAWKLGWNLELGTIIYSAAFGTAAIFCLVTWTVKKRGPTYPPMFTPLNLLFVAVLEALFLGEGIHIGTMVGMVLIVAGLYTFLIGKRKEMVKSPETGEAGQAALTTN